MTIMIYEFRPPEVKILAINYVFELPHLLARLDDIKKVI